MKITERQLKKLILEEIRKVKSGYKVYPNKPHITYKDTLRAVKRSKSFKNEYDYLNEGIFDNIFGFSKPPQQIISDNLIEKHVLNFYTAAFLMFEELNVPGTQLYDLAAAAEEFEKDLKSQNIPPIIVRKGFDNDWNIIIKASIKNNDVVSLRDLIKLQGKDIVTNNPQYKRYKNIALVYVTKNER